MKNVSNLGTPLSKNEQKEITGGWGFCSPGLIECYDDQDCPFCSFGCGITFTLPDGTVQTANVCAF
jgi:anaerobic selenocysteine-containing dehydrogenase